MKQFDLEADAISVLEEILDREDMDYDTCSATENFYLCGSSWCAQCGCIVDKLLRARIDAKPTRLATLDEGRVRS